MYNYILMITQIFFFNAEFLIFSKVLRLFLNFNMIYFYWIPFIIWSYFQVKNGSDDIEDHIINALEGGLVQLIILFIIKCCSFGEWIIIGIAILLFASLVIYRSNHIFDNSIQTFKDKLDSSKFNQLIDDLMENVEKIPNETPENYQKRVREYIEKNLERYKKDK